MGGEVYLAEYGRAKTIHFDLVEVDGVDLRVDAADGGSDCIVMTDEAAEGTATNDFVDEGTGYSLVLTAAEMAGARITVYVIDSATKVWLDKAIHIETFGHQSSAHPNMSPYWTNGAVNDGSATSSAWTFDGFTEATADHLIGGLLTFTSGVNLGQSRAISDSTSTVITVGEAFIAAPADNDEFVIEPRPAASGYIADAVWDEVLSGATHNVSQSAGRRLRSIEEFAGYGLGAIWIDTINGVAGTTNFENGTTDNPVDTIGDANTLAASLKINRFIIAPGSSITFAAAQENQEFLGRNWTLALGGQSVSNSHFNGADVSGTGTSATEVHFDHCEIGTCTLGAAHIDQCDLEGTITLSATATYRILGCYHSGAAVIDFGDALASTTVHIHDYHAALTISEFGSAATDILHFSSADGKLTMDSTCIGGTLNLNGTFDFVNNGSGMTINRDGQMSVDQIWDEARSGHTTDGSVGQAMRKMLDIDVDDTTAANAGSAFGQVDDIQTDTAGLAGSAMRGTDSVVTSGPTKSEMDTAHALLATPAQVNTEVDNAFTTQMADSVPADGTISTREQAMYAILQILTEMGFSGTTGTVKKVDGSTTLMTFTIDDATNPTSITRAT